MDYQPVVNLILNLRKKGATLSYTDLGILAQWEAKGYKADFLLEFLVDLAQKYQLEKRAFPWDLKVLDQELKKLAEQKK